MSLTTSQWERTERNDRSARFAAVRKTDNLELLQSPSRGLSEEAESLSEPAVQIAFWEHINRKIDKYLRAHKSFQAARQSVGPARDALELLLLDLRKLREGLLAARRQDSFAVSVYERSIQLAIHARNPATLSLSLPILLRQIYANDSLENDMAGMTLAANRRELYLAIYLLHLLNSNQPLVEFYTVYSEFIWPSSSIYVTENTTYLKTAPCIRLASKTAKAYQRSDWAALRKLRLSATEVDPQGLLESLIEDIFDRQRNCAWECLAKAYMAVPLTFLGKQLDLQQPELALYLGKYGKEISGGMVTMRPAKVK